MQRGCCAALHTGHALHKAGPALAAMEFLSQFGGCHKLAASPMEALGVQICCMDGRVAIDNVGRALP